MIPFARRRPDILRAAEGTVFDVIVVGGGITGAGIARDLSLAGCSVALFEADDFASGTSSRSTKIFHGGLRYLEKGDWRLVRESGREREWMARQATHLLRPLPMLLPVYRGERHGLTTVSLAVYLYDWLAGVSPAERRRVLTPAKTTDLVPFLRPEGLVGGVLYHEYVTDDARTTITVLRAALRAGAVACNYAPVVGLLREEGRVAGVVVEDALAAGRRYTIRGRLVINATGPWSEEVLSLEARPARPLLLHSRGIHIVLPKERLPLRVALSVPTSDRRLLFLIPRPEATYVGTTDVAYQGDLRHPPVPEEEVRYLLREMGRYLAGTWRPEEVIGSWSGVRPLVHQAGRPVKDVSRREAIWVSPGGLVTIAGGKLTAWRQMAEEVVRLTYRLWPKQTGMRWPGVDFPTYRQRSRETALPGGGLERGRLNEWVAELAEHHGLALEDAHSLVGRYGQEAPSVLELGRSAYGEEAGRRLVPELPLLKAELPYLLSEELAVRLSDLVIRRTSLAWFRLPLLRRHIGVLAASLAEFLGWSAEEQAEEVEAALFASYSESLPEVRS